MAPSLHSRSVNTDLIKTSRSSTRSPVQATAAALHLMGHFYLNACRINVFEAPPAPTPSSLFLCQWKYALIRFMATERASGAVRVAVLVGRGHLDDVGGRSSSSIMRNAFRKIARGFGRPLR